MNDEEFLTAFEDCTLEEFHHSDHIRMAWLYLRNFGYTEGSAKIKEGIKRFAAAKGATNLYHETITEFWIRLVQHVIENHPAETFEEFFASFPPLQDSQSIYRHYTKEFLMSDGPRAEWYNPDLWTVGKKSG
jgi:hypothetical protein